MNKSEIELKLKTIRNNNALPEKQKGMLIDKYEKMLAEMGGGEPAAKPKAERKPRTAKPKAETTTKGDEYDCDDLIEDAKERKAKALAAYEKRKNAPKKSATTKAKETIEKAEKTVEKAVKKGDISISEIEKIISEYEDAIQKLKDLLERAKGKMKQGGSVDPEEVEHILMKAQGIKEHHCKCNDKMKDGGSVQKPTIYFYNDGEKDITFTTFDDAYNEIKRLGYSKFRDNLGGEHFVNKDLSKKNIFQHKSNPDITLEIIENTNKGIKGLQKNPKSLSQKERKEGIIVYYSDSEMKQLFNKKFEKGGSVGKEYKVFNYTDNLYATDETFDKMKDAKAFISMFRSQFAKQGYYKDNKGNKIAPKDIDLEIIPADFNPMPSKFANGGSVENEISYIDSRIKNLSSMRAVANPDERDYFDNQISKLEKEKANLSNPGKKRWFF